MTPQRSCSRPRGTSNSRPSSCLPRRMRTLRTIALPTCTWEVLFRGSLPQSQRTRWPPFPPTRPCSSPRGKRAGSCGGRSAGWRPTRRHGPSVGTASTPTLRWRPFVDSSWRRRCQTLPRRMRTTSGGSPTDSGTPRSIPLGIRSSSRARADPPAST